MNNKKLKIYNKRRDFILPLTKWFGFGLMLVGSVTMAIGAPVLAICEFAVGFIGAGYSMLEEHKTKSKELQDEKNAFAEVSVEDYKCEHTETKTICSETNSNKQSVKETDLQK